MENTIANLLTWVTNHKELFDLIIVIVSTVFGKALVGISRVHKEVIDNAETVGSLSDEEKLQLATDDVVTLFGKQMGWILAIPGAEALIKWIVQVVYNSIKPK